MSAATDRLDAELRKAIADRAKVQGSIEAQIQGLSKLRTLYANIGKRLDALLEDRADVKATEERARVQAEIADDIVRLEHGADVPPPTPPPAAPALRQGQCTCVSPTGARVCPVHGQRPSHL